MVIAIALAGCASAPPPDEEAEQTIADILAAPAPDVEPRTCLSMHLYDAVEVLDQQRVLFSGAGNRHWLNELRRPCVGLRRNQTLLFRLRTGNVCDMDSFNAVHDPWWWFSSVSGHCALGKFHPVTADQVMLIRRALGIKGRRREGPGFEVESLPPE